MKRSKLLLGPMRVPFLILAPVCVLVGVGVAAWRAESINAWEVVLTFIGGLAAHISVNALNEYFDFASGLDSRTRRTPFSGGSGTLQEHPELAPWALIIGTVAAAITAAIGVYFLIAEGWGILPVGVLGLLDIVVYTLWITRHPVLCLVSPGLGFGILMVMGIDFVLTGSYSWSGFFASLVPFFLVNNLLLLNQFPDAEADETVGRKHLPIVVGKRASSIVYGLFLFAAYLSITIGVLTSHLPPMALLVFVSAPLAAVLAVNAYRHAEDLERLMPSLGLNVLLNLVAPVLVAIGLFLG